MAAHGAFAGARSSLGSVAGTVLALLALPLACSQARSQQPGPAVFGAAAAPAPQPARVGPIRQALRAGLEKIPRPGLLGQGRAGNSGQGILGRRRGRLRDRFRSNPAPASPAPSPMPGPEAFGARPAPANPPPGTPFAPPNR